MVAWKLSEFLDLLPGELRPFLPVSAQQLADLPLLNRIYIYDYTYVPGPSRTLRASALAGYALESRSPGNRGTEPSQAFGGTLQFPGLDFFQIEIGSREFDQFLFAANANVTFRQSFPFGGPHRGARYHLILSEQVAKRY